MENLCATLVIYQESLTEGCLWNCQYLSEHFNDLNTRQCYKPVQFLCF